MPAPPLFKRHWRDYHSESANRPVKEFLSGLAPEHYREVVAAMKDVAQNGLSVARHLQGDRYKDLWEVRADCGNVTYRVLFSPEARFNHVLLSLHAFGIKTQQTPRRDLEVALARLADWRRQGQSG